MNKKNINIWIWLQNGRLVKAISCAEDGTLRIYDQDDNLILKRTGLNQREVKLIENQILKYGAIKLNKSEQPFRYL